MSHHRCLSASSSGNACLPPAQPPQNSLFSLSRGEKQPEHSSGCEGCHGQGRRGGARSPSTKRMHREKGREAGPEKSGSHRKRSLDEVAGSFQPRGAGQELSLAPGTSSPAARVPHGGWEPSGLSAILRTCPRETYPGLPAPPVLPERELPSQTPHLGYICSSSSSIFILQPCRTSPLPEPAPQAAFGGAREAQPRDADPKTHSGELERQQAQPAPAESRAGLPAQWGWLPGQRRERKAPFK